PDGKIDIKKGEAVLVPAAIPSITLNPKKEFKVLESYIGLSKEGLLNAVINKKTECIELGLIDYKQAWDYQEELFGKTVALKIENRKRPESEQVPTPNYLIFCQHPHVYTLGKSGKEEHLLLND